MKKDCMINESATIRDALVAINSIRGNGESLIVVNEAKQMVGSLTDGDIRRGLIAGAELSEEILKEKPEAKILLLTTFSDDEYIVKALKCGVK